jgi:uncharacterized membrane protein YfcA
VEYPVIIVVAGGASLLTFFAGFGLGTLLLPAFAVFFPVPVAVALTAIVHFLNGLFKLVLVGRHASWRIVLRFGLPAIVAALAGAFVLRRLSGLGVLATYRVGDAAFSIEPVKLVIGALMIGFAFVERSRKLVGASVSPRYQPLGGLVSGFFGGLSGHQGAFRSVFLLRAGLAKEAFIGTGVAIAALIDVSRLAVYLKGDTLRHVEANLPLVASAAGAAFLGAYLGSRFLEKMTLGAVQLVVTIMFVSVGLGLALGLL